MSTPLDAYECLTEAKVCFDRAKAATSADVKNQYLDLARHYTELAGAIERLIELHSELDKLRHALAIDASK